MVGFYTQNDKVKVVFVSQVHIIFTSEKRDAILGDLQA